MAAAVAARSRAAATAAWARLLSHQHLAAASTSLPHLAGTPRILPPRRHLAFSSASPGDDSPRGGGGRPKQMPFQNERVVYELLAEQERERKRDREERKKAGEEVDEEAEAAEDFFGVRPLLEKLERRKAKEARVPDDVFWEPTDSDSDEDDERFSADSVRRRADEFDRKCKRHNELLRSFAEAGNELMIDSRPSPPFPPHFTLMMCSCISSVHTSVQMQDRNFGVDRIAAVTGSCVLPFLQRFHVPEKMKQFPLFCHVSKQRTISTTFRFHVCVCNCFSSACTSGQMLDHIFALVAD